MKNFFELMERVQKRKPKPKMVVAAAQDAHVLDAVHQAADRGLTDAILVGNKREIERIQNERGLDSERFEIVDEMDDLRCQCERAAELLIDGKAQCLMKGMVDTGTLFKSLLHHKNKLMVGELISYISIFDIPAYHKLLFMTDPAIVIAPTFEQKIALIQNAVRVMQAFEIEWPKVATLCATEKASEKMPATLDAAKLLRMHERGELTGFIPSGPIALDGAIDAASAKTKKMKSSVAGDADLLLMPSIEAGNIFQKTMTKLMHVPLAGVVMGLRAPIVVTSRADGVESKLHSIAAAIWVASEQEKR